MRIPLSMTTFRSTVARLTAVAFFSCGLLALSALPAAAAPSTGWPETEPVAWLSVLAVLLGGPLLLALGIVAFVFLPPLVRGEPLRPEWVQPASDQRIGGPRRDVGQLAPSDPDNSDVSETGGASGRW